MSTSGPKPEPSDTVFHALERWYASQCDGDWEHDWGVKIATLDNPGWRVEINIAATSLQHLTFDRVTIDRTDHDWVRCWVEKCVFHGAGGPHNLREIVSHFLAWARRHDPRLSGP